MSLILKKIAVSLNFSLFAMSSSALAVMLAVANFFFAVKWIYFLSGSLAPFGFYHAEKVICSTEQRHSSRHYFEWNVLLIADCLQDLQHLQDKFENVDNQMLCLKLESFRPRALWRCCLLCHRIRSTRVTRRFTRFPRVFRQMHGLWKRLTTLVTSERFLSHVSSNMIVQCCRSNKRARTETALERPLSSMRCYMRPQFRRTVKRAAALSALERLGWWGGTRVHL